MSYLCKCSFLEIYNEQITDLLCPSSKNLNIRAGVERGIFVENLEEAVVGSPQEAIDLLLQGIQNRRVAETAENENSSRSHSVFFFQLESQVWNLPLER